MRFFVESIGLLGPGLAGWHASKAVLLGTAPHISADVPLPAPELLPAAERRRTGLPVRLAIAAGLDAMAHSTRRGEALASVFTSSGGDGQVVHEICETLASAERQVSPTRFHNSVHNAPAGYWCIALHAHLASTSLCAFDWSFAAGLLEAGAQCVVDRAAVLLVSYDLPDPEPLRSKVRVGGTVGAALLLVPERTRDALVGIELKIEPRAAAPTRMEQSSLETLRAGNPTGRALPLLRALAAPAATTILMEYLSGSTLNVEIRAI
jgi:hypothetical protein